MRPQHVNSLMPRWTAGCTRAVSSHDPARASRPRPRALAPEERRLARERESEGDLPPVRAGREGAPRHRPPARAALRPVSHGALELQAGAPAGAPRGRGAAHPREIPRQDPRHRREERQGAVLGWGGHRAGGCRAERRAAQRARARARTCVFAPAWRPWSVGGGGQSRLGGSRVCMIRISEQGGRQSRRGARRAPRQAFPLLFWARRPHAVPRALLSGRAADTGWLVGREGWVRRPAGASPAAKHEGVNLRTKERHETKLLVFGSSPRTAAPVRPPRACRTPPGQRAGSHARISTHAAQDAAQSGVGSRESAWPRPRAFGWRAFLFSLVHPLLAVSSSAPECRKSTSRGLYQQRDIRRPAVGTTKHKTSACTPKTERDPLAPQPTADACPLPPSVLAVVKHTLQTPPRSRTFRISTRRSTSSPRT